MDEKLAGLSMGFIGYGKVGTTLSRALQRSGFSVYVYAPTEVKRQAIAQTLGDNAPLRWKDLIRNSDVIWLTVRDDQLRSLVKELAAANILTPGQTVGHTSGRHGVSILEPLAKNNCNTFALHPPIPFKGDSSDLSALEECIFALNGSPGEGEAIGRALSYELGAGSLIIAEEDRKLYHAAMVHGSNHLVELVHEARILLEKVTNENVSALMAPLMRTALEQALAQDLNALTGPIRRGDARTIAAHVAALKQAEKNSILQSYSSLSANAINSCLEKGLIDETTAKTLTLALQGKLFEESDV